MLSLHASYHNAAYVTVFLTQSRNTFYFWALRRFSEYIFGYIFLAVFKRVSLLIEIRVDKVLT